eukprot:gnl/MRDRNA2_/MRDRNA2_87905_c0_seq1.p1 gnl/MRDRNA2_/MRDRNA2_87905_c0~~gnl/MRDRNA2_/MRDRNA2_87905_c0_seq1.p1  ORF type:complete len:324 (+),score=104.82 gnl/MRDRNA2_/MRDRNA2_87905_c0_seq1:76-1047(+)
MQVNAVYFVLSAMLVPVASVLRGAGEQTLMNDMRPEVVRKLLSTVEKEWIHSRAMVLSNVTDNDEAFSEMEKSCVKVSGAIIAGSEGQKDRVTEYMQDVCAADGAHDSYSLCSSFASGVEAEMTDDSEYNRDELRLSKFCRKFWDSAVANVALSEAKQQAEEQAEQERKEKEEAERRAAAEAAQKAEEEARAKAEEEAKVAKAAEAAKAEAQTNQTLTPTSEAQSNKTTAVSSNTVDQSNQTTAVTVSAETNATTSPAQDANADSNSTPQAAPTNSTVRTTSNSTAEATLANATTNTNPVKNINGSYSAKLAAVVKSAVAVKK